MSVVIGIDPGIANTGFGVIESRPGDGTIRALDAGVVEASAELPLGRRLLQIHRAVSELLVEHRPDSMALEDIYFGKNVRTAMAVGQGRGVALLAAEQVGIESVGYTPQAIKLSVCGTGGADKQQVQFMVQRLLGLEQPPNPDHVADALAVAICHAAQVRARAAMVAR